MSTVHQTAQAGFGSGTNELYDRARPTYPSDALSFMRSKVFGTDNLNIIETLLTHPEWKDSIHALHAVEPSEGMRKTFSAKTDDNRVLVHDGMFSDTKEQDAWADALIIAQAFHWAHPNYDAAMKEIARVLKPNATAFFIWNLEDRHVVAPSPLPSRSTWVSRIRDLYEKHENNTPQFRLNLWEATFTTLSYLSSFHPPERFTTEWVVPTTVKGVQERALSKSYVTQILEEGKRELCEEIERILEEEEKRWIDEGEGVFEYPYKTLVVGMRRK
ncbi:hypothetical protein HDV00_010083 [Rhizophlyctis rosea]|nr:hypothetical protein HDV00_010083 [Rhizophlyctis rosea]